MKQMCCMRVKHSLCLLVLSYGVVTSTGCSTSGDASNGSGVDHQASGIGSHPVADTGSRGSWAFTEPGFSSLYFTINLSIVSEGAGLRVEGTELNPRTTEYDEWSMTEACATGLIERAAARHGNEWYIAVRTSGGISIEKWVMAHTAGAYYSELPAATTGIGSDVTTPASIVGIENDKYMQPAGRVRPAVAKTIVASAVAVDPIEVMSVDPDGRYLLIKTESANGAISLLQLALMVSASPAIQVGDLIPMWDFANSPGVADVDSIAQLAHPRRGRVIVLGNAISTLGFWDSDNDGVVDDIESRSTPEWAEKYPITVWAQSY